MRSLLSEKREKSLYLTIDDGPSKHMKEKVDYLISKNIPAIWFCLGTLIEKNPDPVVYAIKKGFIIGNHSYSHKYFSNIPIEEAKKEIRKADKIIDELYEKTKVKRPAKLFRFPYGDKGIGLNLLKVATRYINYNFLKIQDYLRLQHFTQLKINNLETIFPYSLQLKDIDLYWTFDVRDCEIFNKPNPDIQTSNDIFRRLEKLNKRRRDEIILIHDIERTSRLFYQIIDKLIEMNFHFKLPSGLI